MAAVNDRTLLSSERAPHIDKPTTNSNKNLVLDPGGAWHEDWLATDRQL
jgi:hypothetical protein